MESSLPPPTPSPAPSPPAGTSSDDSGEGAPPSGVRRGIVGLIGLVLVVLGLGAGVVSVHALRQRRLENFERFAEPLVARLEHPDAGATSWGAARFDGPLVIETAQLFALDPVPGEAGTFRHREIARVEIVGRPTLDPYAQPPWMLERALLTTPDGLRRDITTQLFLGTGPIALDELLQSDDDSGAVGDPDDGEPEPASGDRDRDDGEDDDGGG